MYAKGTVNGRRPDCTGKCPRRWITAERVVTAVVGYSRGRYVSLMTHTNDAQRFLESLHRFDLAKLLSLCRHEVQTGPDHVWGGNTTRFVVHAPSPIAEALRQLSDNDKKRIGDALSATHEEAWAVADASAFVVEKLRGQPLNGTEALLAELILQREVMIDVATGGSRIEDVEDYYVARHIRISEATNSLALPYDNPRESLWAWYAFWKDKFPTYRERREYVRGLFRDLIIAASNRTSKASPSREPTGWDRVDRALARAREQIERATSEEDYQGVGLLCREVLISVAQAVYDPEVHVTTDGVLPSSTDAKRMIDAFLHSTVPGSSFKEVRAHARASYDLSANLQHRRTADQTMAALCLEATSSTVHVLSILSGR